MGCGYKGLVFCRNYGKHGQGTHCTKMGADSSAENPPNAPEFLSAQFVWPSPKVLDFNEKRLHWASVVRAPTGLSPYFQLFMNGWHFNNYV